VSEQHGEDRRQFEQVDQARVARFSSRLNVGAEASAASRPTAVCISTFVAQRLVVVQVLVAAAQCVQALRQQIAQALSDAFGIARVGDRRGRHAAQTKVSIHLAQQQQPTAAAQIPTAEVGLDHAPPKAAEIDSVLCTLWHRQSSVVTGVRYL
jgi:hypothetical protein